MSDQFQLERRMRHMGATARSDFEHLKDCLLAAADRFADVADLIEKRDGYDPVPFLRASAERYRGEVASLKVGGREAGKPKPADWGSQSESGSVRGARHHE